MTMIEDDTQYDLTGIEFDNFINFIFDHPPVKIKLNNSEQEEAWYWNAKVFYEPENIIRHYIKLFLEPDFLVKKFEDEQLEQGFWAIQSDILDCSVTSLICDVALKKSLRIKCIHTMYNLYQQLFSIKTLDTSTNMWWDSINYDWHCKNRSRSNGGEDLWLQDAIFETLKKIIALPSPVCQYAALHGLSHLHHPETSNLIKHFLKNNPNISQNRHEYAKSAAKFTVL